MRTVPLHVAVLSENANMKEIDAVRLTLGNMTYDYMQVVMLNLIG